MTTQEAIYKLGNYDELEFVKWIACKECYACTGRSKVRAEVVRAWNRRDSFESSENPE